MFSHLISIQKLSLSIYLSIYLCDTYVCQHNAYSLKAYGVSMDKWNNYQCWSIRSELAYANLLRLCRWRFAKRYITTVYIFNLPRLRTTIVIRSNKRKWFHIKKPWIRRYPGQTIKETDYTDDLALLGNTPAQAKYLLDSLEQEAYSIDLFVKQTIKINLSLNEIIRNINKSYSVAFIFNTFTGRFFFSYHFQKIWKVVAIFRKIQWFIYPFTRTRKCRTTS